MIEKRYNINYKQFITLREGENFCPKCNGKGRVLKDNRKNTTFTRSTLECNKCLGSGKLDWIEEIVGKRKRPEVIL
jgi:DnaJ-class molecular chaperone